jgi:PilZ domain
MQAPSSVPQPEHRTSFRYPFDAIVKIEWGSAILEGKVHDISAEGMQIDIPDPLWIGASFSARLELEEPLILDCVVRRVQPSRGMGVSFLAGSTESQGRLAALLAALAKK